MSAQTFVLVIATAVGYIGLVHAQNPTEPFRKPDALLAETCLTQHLIEVHNRYYPAEQAARVSDIVWLLGGVEALRRRRKRTGAVDKGPRRRRAYISEIRPAARRRSGKETAEVGCFCRQDETETALEIVDRSGTWLSTPLITGG